MLVTFRIAAMEPKIEDLSTSDAIRYRATRPGIAINSGVPVGAGIGECSSDEEKYKWRKPVCDEEFAETPEDRKREVWKKYDGKATKIKQIRTNPADVANTVLKMADKRAYVALALQVTAASDIFTQDIEDLPAEIAEGLEGEPAKPPIKQPQRKSEPVLGNTVTFIPEAVSVKTGEKNGKGWTKYGIKAPDSSWYGTFSTEFGNLAEKAKEAKTEITVTWKKDGEYKSIVDLTEA